MRVFPHARDIPPGLWYWSDATDIAWGLGASDTTAIAFTFVRGRKKNLKYVRGRKTKTREWCCISGGAGFFLKPTDPGVTHLTGQTRRIYQHHFHCLLFPAIQRD